MAEWMERLRGAWRALSGQARWLTRGVRPEQFIAALTSPWLHGQPASWADDPLEQVRHYKHWVYAAVQAIAFSVAAAKLRLYARRGESIEEVTNHPFLDLMASVNPIHQPFWLWAQTMTFLELTGNAYWYIAPNRLGLPAEIWIVHSQYMKVIPSRDGLISGYEYSQAADEKIRFDVRDILHFRYPNPQSIYYGRGPLQAAAESVDTHEWLKKAEWASMRQGIYPSLAFETEQELGDIHIERMRMQISQRYAGPDQAGRAMILEKGLTAKPISLSPRELDFLRSSRLTRDEILGIFRVPAAIAGLSEDVNRAVAESMERIYAKYTITPKLRLLEEQLNQGLLPRYDSNLLCRFDSIVPADREADRLDMEARLKNFVTTPNEERRQLGWEDAPWGHVPIGPLGLGPIASVPSPGPRAQTEKTSPATTTHGPGLDESIRDQYRDRLRAYFRGLRARVLAEFDRLMPSLLSPGAAIKGRHPAAAEIGAMLLDPDEEGLRLEFVSAPFLRQSLRAGGMREIAHIGSDAEFDLRSPAAEIAMRRRQREYWRNTIIQSTVEMLGETLSQGIMAGESLAELRRRVIALFDQTYANRELTIAHTESLYAYQAGRQAAREQLGIGGAGEDANCECNVVAELRR